MKKIIFLAVTMAVFCNIGICLADTTDITNPNNKSPQDILPWKSVNGTVIRVLNPIAATILVSVNVDVSSPSSVGLVCNGAGFNVPAGASITCVTTKDVTWQASAGTTANGTYTASFR